MIDLILLLHDDESTPGTVTEWCESRGVHFELVVAPEVKDWKALGTARAAVLFGGDMDVWEVEKHPWLEDEKKFLRGLIQQRGSVFGICLGGELLAEQLGAAVKPLANPQVGWWEVKLASGETLCPLSWHTSEFCLPAGATLEAFSPEAGTVGFSARDGSLAGYQFHSEVDETRLTELLARWKEIPNAHQQGKGEIFERAQRLLAPLRQWQFQQLDSWWKSSCKET